MHPRDLTHSHVWHYSFICVTWVQVRMWTAHNFNKNHLYVCHDSFSSSTWHDSFPCVTWLIHMCGMGTGILFGSSLVWKDSYFFVPWLMTHLYLCHGSCFFFIYDVTHDLSSFVTWLTRARYCTSRHVSHTNESCLTYMNESCLTYE